MNAKQSNLLEALASTHAFLSSTPSLGTLAALPAKIDRLNNHVERLRASAQTQTLPLRGAIGARDQAANAAIDLTLAVAGALRSYATTSQKPVLRALASVARSDFVRARRSERMLIARRVLDAAQPFATELTDFGVTAAMLTDLDTRIAASDALVLTPRRAAARSKAATRTIAKTATAARKLLREEIDPMIETIRFTDPTTYAAYRDARSVFHRRGARTTANQAATLPSPPTSEITPPSRPLAA